MTTEQQARLGRTAIEIARRQIEYIEELVNGETPYSPAAQWSTENQVAHMHGIWGGIGALIETEAFYEEGDPECMAICTRYEKVRNKMEKLLAPLRLTGKAA